MSASWKKVETKDERIFTFSSGTTATIDMVVPSDGILSRYGYHDGNYITKSYSVYVNLPKGYNQTRYRVLLPTWGDCGGQDDLVWYGTHDGSNKLGGNTHTDVGMGYSTERASYYRTFGGTWNQNGKDWNYESIIWGYGDYAHGSQNWTSWTFYWNWVYPTNGYYSENEHFNTHIYIFDSNTNQKWNVGEMKYQLRGHVFYDPNGGNGNAVDVIRDINVDIAKASIPTKNGATFLGWDTKQSGDRVITSWQWQPYKDARLYAQWVWNNKTLN